MKVNKKIKMGSEVFFGDFEGFHPKDSDWLCLMDDYIGGDKAMRMNLKGDDIVMYRTGFTKDDFIKEVLDCGLALKIGKFLVPEFIEYFGVTLEDLKIFKDIIKTLDESHKYEKIIYDSYLENGDFTLTPEQLEKAYESYKAARTEEALKIQEEERKAAIAKKIEEKREKIRRRISMLHKNKSTL